eukprot:270674_1
MVPCVSIMFMLVIDLCYCGNQTLINELPPELIEQIGSYLTGKDAPSRDLTSFSSTSRNIKVIVDQIILHSINRDYHSLINITHLIAKDIHQNVYHIDNDTVIEKVLLMLERPAAVYPVMVRGGLHLPSPGTPFLGIKVRMISGYFAENHIRTVIFAFPPNGHVVALNLYDTYSIYTQVEPQLVHQLMRGSIVHHEKDVVMVRADKICVVLQRIMCKAVTDPVVMGASVWSYSGSNTDFFRMLF